MTRNVSRQEHRHPTASPVQMGFLPHRLSVPRVSSAFSLHSPHSQVLLAVHVHHEPVAESEVLVLLVQLWLLCLLQSTWFRVPENRHMSLPRACADMGSIILAMRCCRRSLPECRVALGGGLGQQHPVLAAPPADLGTCTRLHKQHSSGISPTGVFPPAPA